MLEIEHRYKSYNMFVNSTNKWKVSNIRRIQALFLKNHLNKCLKAGPVFQPLKKSKNTVYIFGI